MVRYQFSKAAQFDLDYLYADGVLKHGLRQADLYYDGLIERFEFRVIVKSGVWPFDQAAT